MRWPALTQVVTVSTLLAAATTPGLTQAPARALPRTSEAEGTKLLTTLCGSCHTRGSIVGEHRSTQNWEEVLEWMIDEGAVMSDDEFDRMLGYLSVRYGRVAINTAPADEIRHVLELTAAQAERIVSARQRGRRFAAVAEVAEVTGVPSDVLAPRKQRIAFD
jgi:hypothetical protein